MSSEVEQWLTENGFAAHRQAFASNHISMELIPRLTREDLAELGLTIGEKHAFLRAAERLTNPTNTSPSAQRVEGAGNPPDFAGERRLVSVLFCDIVESTRLTSLIDAEELGDVLGAFFASCKTITEHFGGLCGDRMGDGIASLFGWRDAHEDDPARAVHAALMMTQEIPKIPVPSSPDWRLDVRVGIATGHVVISRVAGRESPQIIGETPNLAERMKQACPPASVVIDAATRRLVGANFELVELGDRLLKGFDEPVQICQVLAPRAGLTRFEGAHFGGAGRRLVGREGDMAMLKARWDLARNGEGQVMLLTGQAGIGKSRVATALAEWVTEQGSHLQIYQCSQLYQNTALYPLVSRIIRDSKIRFSDGPGEKIVKLGRLPNFRFAANRELMFVFASLLSIPPHDGFVPPSMSPDDWRFAIFHAIFDEVARLGEHRPVLLVVEDAHWIDPTSLELLDGIIARSPKWPLLVLITSREDGLKGRWNQEANFTHLQLNRLSPSQSRQLCRDILNDEAIEPVREQIVSAAQGVPLFLEEFATHFQELPGRLAGKRTVSQFDGDPEVTIPNHLYSFLAERLDLLDTKIGAKRVAQTAAVFGHDFSIALLARVPSLEGIADINAAVDNLLGTGLLVKSDGGAQGMSFRHSVFREVLYATLLRSTRRDLHSEIATVLIDAGVAAAEPDIAAHHLTEAQRTREAIEYWTTAGSRSNEKSAAAEAFSHFSKGLELIRQLPDSPATYELELPLRLGFGGAASAIEGYSADKIEQNYSRMLFLANALDRPHERFRAHLGLGAFYEVGGDVDKSQLHCEECLRSAELSGDHDELLHAHRLMGELNFYQGKFRLSCEHFEAALSLYDPKDHLRLIGELGDDPGVLSRMYSALSLWFLGFPDQARENCSKGLELAGQLGHAFTSAQADFYASWFHAFSRDWPRAKSFAEWAIDRSTAQQFALVLGLSRVIRGWSMSRTNEQAAGEKDILDGMALIRGPHADICESSFLTFLADHYMIMGDVEKGLSIIEESKAVATERFATADRLRLHGELLAGRDAAAAERLLREAMVTAREQQSLSMELRSALSLYKLLVTLGRAHQGLEQLRDIYSRFTEGFETADLKECSVLLTAGDSFHRDG
jgi:class 3 adenylate cyclase/tetratricopeptide (TPR) repeat protein